VAPDFISPAPPKICFFEDHQPIHGLNMPEIDAGANAQHASMADSCAGTCADTVSLAQAKRVPLVRVRRCTVLRTGTLMRSACRLCSTRDGPRCHHSLYGRSRIGAMRPRAINSSPGAKSSGFKGDWQ